MNTYTEHHAISYHSDAPAWLDEFCAVPEMQRLRGVGMNCGCEYTAFPRFLGLPRYSRFRHSVGVCLITWHFTGEIEQALAALFHDISTPSFAHTVDFLHGDYLRQEYTEGRTAAMITQSPEIMALLGKYGVAPDAVTDYHLYPIADNDSPRLSADRLEYTLGNACRVFHAPEAEIRAICDDLFVGQNEAGEDELCFAQLDAANAFTRLALRQSQWFVSDDDRFSMQYLADLLHAALDTGALTMDDLYSDEESVIAHLLAVPALAARWQDYRCIVGTVSTPDRPKNVYAVRIAAKKRSIDPLVRTQDGPRRFSSLSPDYAARLAAFRADDFARWVQAVYE